MKLLGMLLKLSIIYGVMITHAYSARVYNNSDACYIQIDNYCCDVPPHGVSASIDMGRNETLRLRSTITGDIKTISITADLQGGNYFITECGADAKCITTGYDSSDEIILYSSISSVCTYPPTVNKMESAQREELEKRAMRADNAPDCEKKRGDKKKSGSE